MIAAGSRYDDSSKKKEKLYHFHISRLHDTMAVLQFSWQENFIENFIEYFK
jgi:hypothetical protein